VRILSVRTTSIPRTAFGAAFQASNDLRHIEGFVGAFAATPLAVEMGAWRPVIEQTVGDGLRRILETTLDQRPGALDLGGSGRELGEAVIDVISSELAARGRENGFAEKARQRLFGGIGETKTKITATSDWVFFHRRRTKRCGDTEITQPVAIRRFRWYHAVVTADGPQHGSIDALRGSLHSVDAAGRQVFARVRAPLDHLGFAPIATVEFEEGSIDLASSIAALRTVWSADDRGMWMRAAAIATEGPGEGTSINLARLRSSTAAIGDLIDLSETEMTTLTTIPPEFQSPGFDGIIASVGVARAPVTTACAHVYQLTPEQYNRMLALLPRLTTLAELRQLATELQTADPIVARYEDDAIVNPDEITAWWQGRPIEVFAIVFDRTVFGSSELIARWMEPRRAALGKLIGTDHEPIRPDQAVDMDLDGCEALFLVMEV
jgi:hypothetical protein